MFIVWRPGWSSQAPEERHVFGWAQSVDNCMADHTHILIGLKPNIALSDLVGDIKTGSTNHINEKRWVAGRFSWQEGFGAFSYSHSQLSGVIKYIQEQEKHHARKTFRQEYLAFLKKFEVRYDERYIFKSLDEE